MAQRIAPGGTGQRDGADGIGHSAGDELLRLCAHAVTPCPRNGAPPLRKLRTARTGAV